MRVMAVVHSIPKRLDEAVPWHFFQELEALVAQGVELCVGSTITPEYVLPGIEFVNITPPRLRTSPYSAFQALLLDRALTSRLPGWAALPRGHRLRLASWNLSVARHAERFRAQVLHSHWAVPLGTGAVPAARSLRLPSIMTLRGTDHLVNRACGYGDCLDPIYERTLQVALRHTDLITVTCQDSIRRLGELEIEGGERVLRIDHSVDGRRFAGSQAEAQVFARAHGIEPGGTLIACIAVMDHERKGHADLLRACQGLLGERDARLVLVGDGRLRPALEALARSLGLGGRVHFLGKVHPSDVQHVLRIATVSVLPTWTEAFGNVAFESLLVGTPVVTSRVGAPGEAVESGHFGEVYEPRDVDGLRQAIASVLDDLDRARQQAMRGADHVRQHLSVARRAREFMGAYERVCREHSAVRADPRGQSRLR